MPTLRARLAIAVALLPALLGAVVLLSTGPAGAPALPVSAVVDDDGLASATNCNATAPAPATVAAGITAATSNSILKICPGTYNVPVTLPAGKPGLQLHGAHAGKDARNRHPNEAGATELTGGVTVQGDDQSVDGFTIAGTPSNGVFASGAIDVTIANNLITAANGNGIQAQLNDAGTLAARRNRFFQNNLNGIAIVDSRQATVVENAFQGNGSGGIESISANHVTIERNQSIDDHNFVSIYACSQGTAVVTVGQNKVSNPGGPRAPGLPEVGGIYVTDTGCLSPAGPLAGVLLSLNVIDRAPLNGILVDAQNPVGVTIEQNTVRDSTGSGIHLVSTTAAVRVEANNVARSATFDCDDDSSGGGTSATDNIWTRNHGRTSSPAGLCR